MVRKQTSTTDPAKRSIQLGNRQKQRACVSKNRTAVGFGIKRAHSRLRQVSKTGIIHTASGKAKPPQYRGRPTLTAEMPGGARETMTERYYMESMQTGAPVHNSTRRTWLGSERSEFSERGTNVDRQWPKRRCKTERRKVAGTAQKNRVWRGAGSGAPPSRIAALVALYFA